MNAEEQAICDVLEDYAAKATAGDLAGWLGLWSDDGVQMPPDAETAVGKSQIGAGMAPAFESMDLQVSIDKIESVVVDGSLGVTRCRYSISGTPKGGGDTVPVMPDGKALTVYRREANGSWRIAFDCFNANPASSGGE